jgi:hypothetical protein
MQASHERKTNGRWKVAHIDPPTSMQVTTHVHNEDRLRKQIEEEAKTPKEKEDLIKSYQKAKLPEVSVYIARVLRKNQHKDSIKFAYNFE